MEVSINGKKYRLVLGFEIHLELSTKSKMFCRCSAEWFGKEPNTTVCPICLGFPGTLPYPNKKAIEYTYKIAYALNCNINSEFYFDRKHYFYPDLPKGYQITQWNKPIGFSGSLELISGKKIKITRVHLEEDTGKLIHKQGKTLVDYNRAGVPLVEIVTEPDFDNLDDGKEFLENLQLIFRRIKVSTADMEKGSMRLEPNMSLAEVKPDGNIDLPDYKVELKNINSFRYAKKAVEYEIERQTKLIKNGKRPIQETRGYNEDKGITVSQRKKEEALDYRYFPEPDIPPIKFDKKELKKIKKTLPELPIQQARRFIKEYFLSKDQAIILTKKENFGKLFEETIKELQQRNKGLNQETIKQIANLIINSRTSLKNKNDVLKMLDDTQKKVNFDKNKISATVKQVLSENQQAVADYKNGKESAIMFLVGQSMRKLKGQAPAEKIKELLISEINKAQ
ncbi:MAG: aspartyl/glutamyl-tRNA(Asn/Gln) amidotransferase subunit B [Patescibacteria group bacterium]|nr:MAG: aspartyl/glutamyl-tRNA(Asn/Gln) amidotransferase subunit B [Patescibacteria group bacterium]